MSHRIATLPLALLLVTTAAQSQQPDRTSSMFLTTITAGRQPQADPCVEHEPNETPETPAPFPLPGSCTGSASAADPTGGFFANYPDGTRHSIQDFWGFELALPTELDALLTFNDDTNLDLALFDEGLRRGQLSHQPSGTFERVRTSALAPGRYVLAVIALSGSSSYTLSVSVPAVVVPPTAPANLAAVPVSDTAVELVWADTSDTETQLRIERRDGAGAFAEIATIGPDATTFRAEGLSPATAYTFRVRARNSAGNSPYSNEVTVTTLASATAPCVADDTTLCLRDGRFRVRTLWQTESGQTGFGTAVPLTDDTGTFWFFSPTNVEVVVKVLNACFAPFDNHWVFAAGLTDLLVVTTVTDTLTGAVRTYVNFQKTPFQPVQDTEHFKTSCP